MNPESRRCPECGVLHNLVLEDTATGEVIEVIDKCKNCLLGFGPNGIYKDGILEIDQLIRGFLESTPSVFHIDDGDETYFKYWVDRDLKIRTCHECKSSEFKSPKDGVWMLYFTEERLLWFCDQFEKGNSDMKCSLCKKFCDRWRNLR